MTFSISLLKKLCLPAALLSTLLCSVSHANAQQTPPCVVNMYASAPGGENNEYTYDASFENGAPSTGSVTIQATDKVQNGCGTWTATAADPWITITSVTMITTYAVRGAAANNSQSDVTGGSGSGYWQVNYSLTANTGAARQSTLNFNWPTPSLSETFNVYQTGFPSSVLPSFYRVDYLYNAAGCSSNPNPYSCPQTSGHGPYVLSNLAAGTYTLSVQDYNTIGVNSGQPFVVYAWVGTRGPGTNYVVPPPAQGATTDSINVTVAAGQQLILYALNGSNYGSDYGPVDPNAFADIYVSYITPPTVTCNFNNGPTYTNTAYTDTCNAYGGTAPYTWTISSGQLPIGLSLSSSGPTATISGTPTTPQQYNYTLSATDSTSPTNYVASQSFSGNIIIPESITSLSPASVIVGAPGFTLTVNGSGFNYYDTVYWNSTSLSTQYVSSTQLTATVPASFLSTPAANHIFVSNYTQTFFGGAAFNVLPSLTSLSPNSASAGGSAFTLTANGAGFLNNSGTYILWNNAALPVSFAGSTTQITANIPANLIATPGTAQVSVASGGTISAPLTFTIQAGPTLTSISPSVVAAGGTGFTLTATGTNFVSGAFIRWNAQNLVTLYVSPTQMTATVPASLVTTAGSAQVSVFSGGATTGNLTETIYQIPTITVSPSSITAGSSAFTLTVTGSGPFLTPVSIGWNGSALPATIVSSNVLTTTVPANLVTTAGTAQVSVTTAGLNTSPATFTINQPAITITSLSPPTAVAGGPAFNLVITGTNLNFPNGAAYFNNVQLSTISATATQLTVAVPANLIATAGTFSVQVQASGYTAANTTFTILPTPVLTSFSPPSAVAGGPAFTLTANGANFTSGTVLQWNGTALTTSFVGATQLSAAVPASLIAAAGTAQVSIAGVNSPSLPFTISAPPTLTLNPSSVVAGSSSFTLSVTGSSLFSNSATIQWNGTALPTTFTTGGLSASVPANLVATAGTAQVTVLSNGVTSQPATFTILPAATITSLSPSSVTAGAPAFTLTVTGTNFASGATVQWNGSAIPTTFVSATALTASVPASLITNAGTAQVTVASGGATSAPAQFTVTAGPTLTAVNPASTTATGPAFTLTATGTNFTSSAVVQWNGQALATTFASSTQLTAAVPASLIGTAGSSQITIVSGGATSSPLTFQVLAAPSLTSVTPTGATATAPGFTITAFGANFTSGTVLRWNGQPLTTTFVSPGQLTAPVPASLIANPGSAQITVFSGGVSSANITFTIAPAPAITFLSPNSATAGGSGFTLTVTGSNFVSGSVVQWNGAALATIYVSPTQLTALVPANLLAAAGTVPVTVASGGATSPSANFSVLPAPTLTSLSPSSTTAGGAAFTLTVNGTGFASGATVLWSSAALPTTFVSATQLTAAVPASLIANPGTFQVGLTSGGVSAATSLPFTVVNTPTLTFLSPNSAAVGGPAFTLTVSGSGFASGATVLWNGAALTTTYVSATQVTAAVPASFIATAGTFPINVVSGGVSTPTSLPFTVTPPTLTSISPSTTTAGGAAFTLTVNGAGFNLNATVFWAGTSLTTTFVSATQLTAAVPASLISTTGTFPISVTSGGITSATTLPFTVVATPTLTSLTPNTTTAGGGAFTLTVTGSGFTSDAAVLWSGAALTTTYVSATQLTAAVPAALIANPGTVQVGLVSGGATASATLPFTVVAEATLTSLTPNTVTAGGAAFSLTVNGSGFGTDATALWNGAALTTTVVSPTQLTAAVPASLITTTGVFPITVVSGGVASTNALQFVVVAAPTLTTISPSIITAGSADFTLTLSGTGFGSAASVLWNGTSLATTFVSATQLTAVVPAALVALPGLAQVTVVSGGAPSNTLGFTVLAPTFLTVTPATVVAGGPAFTLTVNGSGFASGATVLWNGTALTTTFVSAAQLTAAVPANLIATAGAAAVTITSGGSTLGPLTVTIIAGPALTSLGPTTATAGGSAFTVTVNGSGFGPDAVVQWNGAPLTTTVVSSTQLTAAVPANLIAAAGSSLVTVTSGGVTSAPLSFATTAALPPTPVVSLVGLGGTATPTQNLSVGVQLAAVTQSALQGTLRLSFAPSVSGLPTGYMDPALQFASGGVSVNFTIPAGSNTATVPQSGAIQQGTVAGTIAVTLTALTSNGTNVLPSATVTANVVVPPLPPVIVANSVKIVNVTPGGFTVALTGYSTTREVTVADFIFTAANGSQILGSSEFSVPVSAPFATWFSSTQGQSFGSQFALQVPFTISGGTSNIVQSVSATLRNSAGTSTAVSGTR